MFFISLISAVLLLSMLFFLVAGGVLLGASLLTEKQLKFKGFVGLYSLCFAISALLMLINFNSIYNIYLSGV